MRSARSRGVVLPGGEVVSKRSCLTDKNVHLRSKGILKLWSVVEHHRWQSSSMPEASGYRGMGDAQDLNLACNVILLGQVPLRGL